MFIDQLEPRQMLAGDLQSTPTFAKLSRTGTLFITGTSVRDTITVRSVSNYTDLTLPSKLMVQVTLSSKYANEAVVHPTLAFPQGEVKRINISSGAGNDLVIANTGIKGRTVLYGGKGDDRLETTGKYGSLFGDSGDDILTSNTPVTNVVYGSTDPDQAQRAVPLSFNFVSGGDGNDTFRTRGGDDSLVGGTGSDRYEPLEAGIVTTVGTTLPDANYEAGTHFGISRIALDSIEVIGDEPTDQEDVKVWLNLA